MTEPYTLYNGDCFDFLPTIPVGSVDLLLTDPPYGITACSWDVVPNIPRFWRDAWRVLKPNGAAIIFGTAKSGIDWIMASRKEFRYDLVWNKTCAACFLNVNRQPIPIHETIYIFYRSLPVFHPQKYRLQRERERERERRQKANRYKGFSDMGASSYIETNERFYKSVLTFSNYNGGGTEHATVHSTQKPIALMEHLIKMYTNPGETVLDPFMGSGSTGVAAMMTGRKFLGSELDPHFFKIAEKRIADAPVPPTNGEIVLVKPNDEQGYLIFEDAK